VFKCISVFCVGMEASVRVIEDENKNSKSTVYVCIYIQIKFAQKNKAAATTESARRAVASVKSRAINVVYSWLCLIPFLLLLLFSIKITGKISLRLSHITISSGASLESRRLWRVHKFIFMCTSVCIILALKYLHLDLKV
jgi:hypothetical protein